MIPPRRLTLASVLLGLLEFGVAEGVPVLTTFCVIGAVFAWWFTEGRLGRPLPQLLVSTLTGCVVVLGIGRMIAEGVSVSVFSEMVMLLVVVKLFDIKTARDRAQVATLSVVLLVGAVLTNSAVLVGLSLFVHLSVLAVLTPRLIMHSAFERVSKGVDPAGPAKPAGHPKPERHPKEFKGLTRISLFQAAIIAALGVVVFAIAPRGMDVRPFGEFGRVGVGQQTGFTDTVSLGQGGLISESTTPVLDMRVTMLDSNDRERSVGGPGIRHYLRGAVLDEYRNRRWTRSTRTFDNFNRLAIVQRQTLGRHVADADLIQRITIRQITEEMSHLFSIWQPQLIEFDTLTEIIWPGDDAQILVQGQSGRFEYTVRSRRDKPFPAIINRRPGASFESDIVRDFADGVLRDAGLEPDPARRPPADDLRAVEAIENAFREGFAYTLDINAAPRGQDPIEWFLETEREGHCEYFASAMAAACRSVGIHARLISGYLVTEYNDATQSYIVRESDAHAWVEAEIAADVWRRFDPTPPAELSRIHEPSGTLWARAGRVFDTLEQTWINSVVSYDAETQFALLGGPLRALGIDSQSIERRARNMTRRDAISAGLSVMMVLTGATLIFVVRHSIFMLLTNTGRWLTGRARVRKASRPHPGSTAAEAELFRAISSILRRRSPGVAPFGVRLAKAVLPEADREPLERGISMYNQSRFGPDAPSERQLRAAAAAIRALRHTAS